MKLRFAEELMVLTVHPERSGPIYLSPRTLGSALAGAVLMDLALENRIDADAQELFVTDSTPLGDSLLDPVLADIVGESPPPLPTETWVTRIAERGEDLRAQTLDRLVARNILEADDGGVFSLSRWVAHSRRYPVVDGTAEREIRSRILGILLSDDIPSPRDSVIISLAHACGIFRRILSPSEYEDLRARIELIAGLELVTRSVSETIHSVNLAESLAIRHAARKRGAEWPKACGRWPAIGHLFKLTGNLAAFCTEQYQRHGPVFEVSVLGKTFVVIAGQEANVFVNKEGRHHLRTHELWSGFGQMVGAANVLIGLDGANHRLLRSTNRRSYSRSFILGRIPEAVAIVERELGIAPAGRPVVVVDFMRRIMVEQLARLATRSSAREHIDDIVAWNEKMHLVYINRRYPKFVMHLPRIKRIRRRLEALIEQVLSEHESGPDTEEERDLIDDLIELHRSAPDFMPETDLFIAAMSPFMVGADTVTSVTSFAVYALLTQPELLAEVRAEADELFASGELTQEGLDRMDLHRGVIMETLRVYPIASVLSRTVTNSFEFAGYRIHAGTQLLIAVSVPHRLPEFFPEPERFDIKRYSPERQEHLHPGVFAPFGLGHHSCLGRGFAEVQMVLTLATLLHRADIALDPPGYRLKTQWSPAPKPNRGFRIRLRPRQ